MVLKWRRLCFVIAGLVAVLVMAFAAVPSAPAHALTITQSWFVNSGGAGLTLENPSGSTLEMEPMAADGDFGNKSEIFTANCSGGSPDYCELGSGSLPSGGGTNCLTAEGTAGGASDGVDLGACSTADQADMWEQVSAGSNAEGAPQFYYENQEYGGYLKGGTTVGGAAWLASSNATAAKWVNQSEPIGIYTANNDAPPVFPVTANYGIYYCGLECAFPSTVATDDWDAGTTLLLKYSTSVGTGQSFCSTDTDGDCTPSEILGGALDTKLSALGAAISSFGHPVLMALDWEANGGPTPANCSGTATGWYYYQQCWDGSVTSWTPAEYAAVSNYITGKILAADTAGNLTLMFDPNVEGTGTNSAGPYLSGTGYSLSNMSIMGADGYYSYASGDETWSDAALSATFSDLQADEPSDADWVAETGVNQANTSANVNSEIDNLVSSAESQLGAGPVFYLDVNQTGNTPPGSNWQLATGSGGSLDEFVQDIGG
jgi:hypothetical protein